MEIYYTNFLKWSSMPINVFSMEYKQLNYCFIYFRFCRQKQQVYTMLVPMIPLCSSIWTDNYYFSAVSPTCSFLVRHFSQIHISLSSVDQYTNLFLWWYFESHHGRGSPGAILLRSQATAMTFLYVSTVLQYQIPFVAFPRALDYT